MPRKPTPLQLFTASAPEGRDGSLVAQINGIMEVAQVPGILIGALAIGAYLEERLPLERSSVDLAVAMNGLATLRRWFANQPTSSMQRTLAYGGVEISNGGPVVIRLVARFALQGDLSRLYGEAVRTGKKGPMTEVWGVRWPVALPEYLVAMKLGAGRDQDEVDVVRFLKVAGKVDANKFRTVVRKHLGVGSLGRLEVLLRKAGHPGARTDEAV